MGKTEVFTVAHNLKLQNMSSWQTLNKTKMDCTHKPETPHAMQNLTAEGNKEHEI